MFAYSLASRVAGAVATGTAKTVTINLEFVEHAGIRAAQRGFTNEVIEKIIREGTQTFGKSQYGTRQVIYELGGNKVVKALEGRNINKIITVMSNAEKGIFIPFK